MSSVLLLIQCKYNRIFKMGKNYLNFEQSCKWQFLSLFLASFLSETQKEYFGRNLRVHSERSIHKRFCWNEDTFEPHYPKSNCIEVRMVACKAIRSRFKPKSTIMFCFFPRVGYLEEMENLAIRNGSLLVHSDRNKIKLSCAAWGNDRIE